jgi:hypothetical protein
MIETIYVVLRVDHALVSAHPDKNLGVEGLGYSASFEEGCRHMETCASLDLMGKSWTPSSCITGVDAFYDPDNEEGLPPPPGKFMVWDRESDHSEDPVLDRPSSVAASISVFDEEPPPGALSRDLIRSYKLVKINPVMHSFLEAPTEADRELARQLAESSSTL